MYIQRYMQHFPAAGEIVVFDRSWYNRAGVEHVMGFCSKDQYRQFLEICPEFEKYIVDGGIILIKFWLEVGKKEQQRRFEARKDPCANETSGAHGSGIFSAVVASFHAPGTRCRGYRLETTPRYLIRSDDKRKARLNCISHLLSRIPYKRAPREKVKLPKRSEKQRYDDIASLKGRRFVREVY
jgi:hypothetical protein